MPNDDYIERRKVIEVLCYDCWHVLPNPPIECVVSKGCVTYKQIVSIPAADVEPVVRCENCQFFENVEYWPDGTKKVCQLLKRQVQENSFCCWGMKKEAEDAE